MLDNERKNQTEENRRRLLPIIKTIILHGKQNIPLRGHRDDTTIFELDSDGDFSLTNLNDGNFKALLRFRIDSGDKDLENHLKNAKSNATYISKTTCNSLIKCCGEEILNTIISQVNESQYYSVLFDETTDVSHHSQLSVSLRYFFNGTVREDFVGFIDLHLDNYDPSKNENVESPIEPKIDGKTLGTSVIRKLQKLGLDLKNCVGVGCDGCSVNVSAVRGAVYEIQKTAVNAVLSSCFNHKLNLSISKTMNVKCVKNAMGIIQEVVSFFNASAKRHFVLKKYLKNSLNSPCETRWIERHDSLLQFKTDFLKICNALNEVSDWNEGNSSSKAHILSKAICDCEFILTVHVLSEIFNVTLPLSKFLQGRNIGLDNATSYVTNVIDVLKQKRTNSENEFASIIQSASTTLEAFALEIKVPRLTSRQTQRVNTPASNAVDYWRTVIFIPVLDYIILDLSERFSDQMLQCFSLNELIPKNLALLTDYNILKEKMTLICKQFSGLIENVESDSAKLLGEVQILQKTMDKNTSWQTENAIETLINIDQNFYPTITKYLKILVTLPISVATAERSFSSLRRIKSWMRSSMKQDRLEGLALLHIHRNIDIEIDRVIDRFAKESRRLQFIL